MFPSNGVIDTAPPSLRRVPRTGSPASTVLWGAPTPCRPSRRASLPSLGDTTACVRRFAPSGRDARPWARGVGVPVSRAGNVRWRRQGLPGSWGTLMCPCPVLRPRQDRRDARPIAARRHGPRLCQQRRLPRRLSFRGSIARPLDSLSTLRRAGHPTPRKTRFRLLARLCRAGFVTRRVPTKGFRVRVLFLLSQACLTLGHLNLRTHSACVEFHTGHLLTFDPCT